MIDTILLRRLSDQIFHEAAEVTDVADQLAQFIDSLSDDQQRSMADSLRRLAMAPATERTSVLDDIGFAWAFDDEAGFFESLSDVVSP